MTPFINSSKYTPPGLSDLISRQRLFDRFEKNANKKVNFVIGQAAQGKSTLVATYLSHSEVPTAWMHLDSEDSEPVNCYYLLVYAVQHALGGDLSPFLTHPPITLGPREVILRCMELVHSLFEQVEGPLNIVIDGLDSFEPDAPSMNFVASLIDTIPRRIRLFVISRETPSFGIQQYKMRREALVLTNDELAFTPEEIGDFFRSTGSPSIGPDEIGIIGRITGGWAGGLILLAESLSNLPEEHHGAYIREELGERMPGDDLSLFFDELYSVQREEIQAFLLRSALFDIIEPTVLKEFPGTEDAARIVGELERKNLFVQSIYDRNRGRIFRYHQLFRDYLKEKRAAVIGREEERELLITAGELYRKRKENESAIKFFLRAEAFEPAEVLIQKVGMGVLIEGRTKDLAGWIESLPAPMHRENPWLLFYLTMTRRISGGKRNIDDFLTVLALFRENGDTRGHIFSLAYLIEAGIFMGHPPEPLVEWLGEGEEILESLRGEERYVYAKAVLWQQIGFGYISGGLDLQKGISACRNAYLLARKMGNPTLQVNAMIVATLGYASAGEYLLAEDSLEKIRDKVEQAVYPEYRTLRNIVNMDLSLKKGDLEKAGEHLETSHRDIEKYGLIFLYPKYIDASGLLKIYRREFEEARQTAAHLSDVALLSNNWYYKGLALRLSGMNAYHMGDFKEAERLTKEAENALCHTGPDNIHEYEVRLMTGLIAGRLKKYRIAERELTHALAYFTRVLSHVSIAETHMAFGLLMFEQNNIGRAIEHLTEGFRIAAEKEYRHLIVMGPEDFTRACLFAMVLAPREVDTYASGLLAGKLKAYLPDGLDLLVSHPVFKKIKSTKEVITRIHRMSLPEIRIETLGGFRVMRGTEEVKEEEWGGSRPRLLLKAIIARGAREIPKDLLIEDMWPECKAAAGEKNFKVNLHRLRKAVEPESRKGFGSSYIHLRRNFISLDDNLFRMDLDRFRTLLDEARNAESQEGPDRALPLFQEAVDLYRGDFLMEEPYVEWAAPLREELGKGFTEALARIAEISETTGDWQRAVSCYRRIIQANPMDEHAYQRLMITCSENGMKNAALNIYEECKRVLMDEIGTDPDPATTTVYRRILESE